MTAGETCERAGHEYEPAAKCRACAAERLADETPDTDPQRPAPAPPEVVQVAERHRAATRTGSTSGRQFAQPAELLAPANELVATCGHPRCGGIYVDSGDGRAAHRVVFGHEPS